MKGAGVVKDLFEKLNCIFPDEAEGLPELREAFREKPLFTAFMPCIDMDFWPLYVLEETEARKYLNGGKTEEAEAPEESVKRSFFARPKKKALPKVPDGQRLFIVPLGGKNFHIRPQITELVEDLYLRDEFPSWDLDYDGGITGIMLMDLEGAEHALEVKHVGSFSAVCLTVAWKNGGTDTLICVWESPEWCWEHIVEKYDIAVDMLVNSSKGFGTKLLKGEMWPMLNGTKKPELLPPFYFNGKNSAFPEKAGFTMVYEVPESDRFDGTSVICETPWVIDRTRPDSYNDI